MYSYLLRPPQRLIVLTLGNQAYNQIRIQYIGTSPTFYATMSSYPNVHMTVSGDKLIASETPQKWVLDRESDPKGGFRYL